jgi:hypothetical protein
MSEPSDTVIDRVKVREVTGVFRTRDALDNAVSDLLLDGFDRANIDIMASVDTVQKKLGEVYVAVEELPDLSQVPRRAFIAREDSTLITGIVAGLLTYIGATAAALGVVASGGALALAMGAAAAGGAAGGIGGLLFARFLGKKEAENLEDQLARGGLVLWVRVRTPQEEAKAIEILYRHEAKAVRVHEIEIDKRLENIPLNSLRPDPWLGDERLGQI